MSEQQSGRQEISEESFSGWRPPEGGITAANLYTLPGLTIPLHTELIDGGLFFPSRRPAFYDVITKVLEAGLNATLADGLRVAHRVPLTLGTRTKVEPDFLVLVADAEPELDSGYSPEAVRLVVEVVPAVSHIRDRELKPRLYAKAGIAHFWQVEDEAGAAVVNVFQLDPATDLYFLTGAQRDRVQRPVPYRLDIPLTGFEGSGLGALGRGGPEV